MWESGTYKLNLWISHIVTFVQNIADIQKFENHCNT
jgi:hypothetical protein